MPDASPEQTLLLVDSDIDYLDWATKHLGAKGLRILRCDHAEKAAKASREQGLADAKRRSAERDARRAQRAKDEGKPTPKTLRRLPPKFRPIQMEPTQAWQKTLEAAFDVASGYIRDLIPGSDRFLGFRGADFAVSPDEKTIAFSAIRTWKPPKSTYS